LIKRKLSGNIEFKKVFLEGKRIESKNLIVFLLNSEYKFNRLGLVVKKEIGKAVVRNKIKRRAREAYRQINRKLFQGYDIIILVKKSVVGLEYFELYSELENLFIKKNFFFCQEKITFLTDEIKIKENKKRSSRAYGRAN